MLARVPESGPIVRHAQLRLGDNIIMLGSTRPEDGMQSPMMVGASTQAICVFVEELDAHFARSEKAGVKITLPLEETDFGTREYHALDLEDHPWIFGSYRPQFD